MKEKARKKCVVILISTILLLNPFTNIEADAAEVSNVNIEIDTSADRKLISSYIYGINDNSDLDEVSVRSIKQGGSRFSTYNWENNFSNAGSEWFNTSDNSLVSTYNSIQQNQPGLVVEDLFNKSIKYNIPFTITTLPMCGYVAADGNGPILDSQLAPSSRWTIIQNKKTSPLSLDPDLKDENVYIDEYINYIINKYGKSTATTGIKAYALDNEPDLWSTTHKTIHPSETTTDELIQKSTELALIIKALDQHAIVLGGQLSGMNGYKSFNNSYESDPLNSEYNWFIDYYLSKMKDAGTHSGKRLLDVLDLHYYSEDGVDGSGTVIDNKDYSNKEINKTRMQSTRTLWDGTYTENSWIGKSCQQYLPLLPTIQASINKYYSGTKLAFSEYNFGGGGDISGGIAEADALGIFGREGIYLACLNTDEEDISYQNSAINIYTNYDGKGSSFGNTSVSAQTSNNSVSSVYASIDNADESVMKFILINKNYNTKLTANISINSGIDYKGGTAYGFNSENNEITNLHNLKNISNNCFSYSIAPLSVVEIILTADGTIPSVTTNNYSAVITDVDNTSTSNYSESSTNSSKNSSNETSNVISSLNSTSLLTESTVPITSAIENPDISQHKVPTIIKIIISSIFAILIFSILYMFLSQTSFKNR